MAGTAQATALDIYEVPFSDLHLLLSPEAVAGDDDEGRRRRLLDTVGAALGRGGTGLLAVAGVPRAGALRRRLLPLARRLARMDHPSRAQLLKKHGLGSDVPLKKLDRSVSSFARLLRNGDSGKLHLPLPESEEVPPPGVDGFGEHNDDIENLGELFKELGLCMMELGILVARACDIVTGGNQLERSITDFGSAKARLIHYRSELDNIVTKENSKNRRNSCQEDGTAVSGKEKDCEDMVTQGQSGAVSLVNLWQEWHYDYGVLTVLTAPLFLCSALGQECSVSEECPPPDGHTFLQLLNKGRIFSVRCSQESFIVQVGEAADILSGGKLRSTLHAVSRPLGLRNISRETFVVFLQPSWDKILPCSGYSSANEDDSSDHDELTF